MIEVSEKVHRILAPRLVVTVGTTSKDGRKNIIPINNITSVSTDPCMVAIAIYKPWITANNLVDTEGFTVSVPSEEQLELIWKLGQKYSGYKSNIEKIDEFKDYLDMDFSHHGPVLKDALGWIEFKVIDRPKDVGGNHLLVIGQYVKAMVNPKHYSKEISPIDNPKPFMQWESNHFASASDIYTIDFFS